MDSWIRGFHPLRIRISMSPERGNVRNSYRLRLKGFTLLCLAILHLRVTRLSVTTFHAHEAQHTLMRIPWRFLTKAKSAPSAEFLRLLERLSPLTAENFSALSALSLSVLRCHQGVQMTAGGIYFCRNLLAISLFLRNFAT